MLKALWTGEYHPDWEKIFEKEFELTKASVCTGASIPDGLLKEDELIPLLRGKDVFIAGYDRITENVLKNVPDLKLILSVRDGPEDNIDIKACTEMGIPVIAAGGRCVHSVAELNLTLMFCLATRIFAVSNRMRSEGWTGTNMWPDLHLRTELFNKTLAIIGLGRNGKELARIANGIGMRVVAYDPYVSRETADELHVTMMSMEEAIREGDYVSLLARVTPETERMFGKEQIDLMKPTAFLINTGRPKLTDEDAIFDALESGRIAGAALDVYGQEPLPRTSRAYDIPSERLLMTPHMAGLSIERCPHQYENTFAAYQKFVAGDRNIENLYNKAVFDSPAFAGRGGLLFGKR